MRLMISFAALFLSVILLQLGVGTLAPLDVLSGTRPGFATMPVCSIATARAHDFATPTERVELSAAVMFLCAAGAIGSPYLAFVLTQAFGPASMFWMIGLAHAPLVVFGFVRLRVRPAPGPRTAYTYEPRTSFPVGRLLRRSRDR